MNEMTEQVIKIGEGEIRLVEEKMIISDKIKRHYRFQLLSSMIWTFYGVTSVLRYLNTGDQFLLWTGLIIGVAHFVIFIMLLFRSTKNEIHKNEISSIKFNKRFGNTFLDIKLKSGRIRRISKIGDISQELNNFMEGKTE
jgi:hypothetical protein